MPTMAFPFLKLSFVEASDLAKPAVSAIRSSGLG
jgi:hypothetical protein